MLLVLPVLFLLLLLLLHFIGGGVALQEHKVPLQPLERAQLVVVGVFHVWRLACWLAGRCVGGG